MSKRRAFKPGKQKRCWCGSGKHFKHCHGLLRAGLGQTAPATKTPLLASVAPKRGSTQAPIQTPIGASKPWGVPGEEYRLSVVPLFEQHTQPLQADVNGKPGRYKVQLLLSKPGFPLTNELERKFIDNEIGDSHIQVTKPVKMRDPDNDPEKIALQTVSASGIVVFTGLPNDEGRLGKLIAELDANNINDAEMVAYNALNPFLSSWSLHLDIPVHIETVQVTELSTSLAALRVYTPNFTMGFAGGITPPLRDEFCNYASLYREAMNTNSNFYRFLCLFKIIESITLRRSRVAQEAKAAGGIPPQRMREEIPKNSSDLRALLKIVYPWRDAWDDFAISQMLPVEAAGKKFKTIRDNHLEPIRVGIAHALLKSGEIRITMDNLEHVRLVNRWLPLCRVFARLMLHNDFPNEFRLQMDTDPVRLNAVFASLSGSN